MDLAKILQEVQQSQEHKDRTTKGPIGDPQKVRIKMLEILNRMTMEESHGKRKLILDPETKNAIELICQYANQEPEYEKDGRDLNKGLWICGNFGSGKTQLIKAYRELKGLMNTTVGIQTCGSMNERFMKRDETNREPARYQGIKAFTNPQDEVERIFDDLGEEEPTVVDFGNRISIMAHILNERYKFKLRTHVTTNLTMDQVQQTYGGRIESRIAETFNIIKLGSKTTSTDYRKL